MTPSKSPEHSSLLKQSKAETMNRFQTIEKTLTSILGSKSIDHYSTINFTTIPLKLNGPRFGATEHKIDSNQYLLELSQELLTQYSKFLEPILWREAYLLHIPYYVRLNDQTADLGLFCYYRYGLTKQSQRRKFLQIWEAVSPGIDYPTYRYYPTIGFPYFDNVVDGTFLHKVTQWFKPFAKLSIPLTTDAYTANLERWMINYERTLRPVELKVLRGLIDCLGCSQIELSSRLNLRQPTISQVVKKLANKHLLRYIIFENYQVLGLQPVTAIFPVKNMETLQTLKQLISRIRYALSINEFDNLLVASFVIPTERITRFRQWVKQLASILNLASPNVQFIEERLHSQNFDLYNPKTGGWPTEYESIILNFIRMLSEDLTSHLPSIQFHKHVSSQSKFKIDLQQQDFIFMQRATNPYLATSQAKFLESHELRKAGYKESEHMAYRRRVKYLEEHEVIGPILGVGLIHIGLNSSIYLYLETELEYTRRLITGCQVFPHVAGRIFTDGTGIATIRVPNESAIAVTTALDDYFTQQSTPVHLSVHPTWDSFGWTGPNIIDPTNYDFKKCKWIWTKDTLPLPKV